ncbi:hypothetical protein PV08_00553 [Exophiala spinifera]|uniref:Amidohydrolase-related domain-containing protein n=1 Tax=Exophiala spinifera TaxID=91928 RepID=A0A0D2BM36_9EURO|nr:uncharacterized protein PV08_00553 [Exophiala spinifera]KIW19978.1 hypothetical protein PV08_00553 [Exophiala spinifera]
MADRSILLQGGLVLTHSSSPDDHVIPLHDTDVLIVGNVISQIAKGIKAPSKDTETIDCRGKIVSPGFIDTHHHLWQTQLKGRHADEGLVAYMVSGNMVSYAYTSSDVYWGQLAGCLEAINCGTTLVLDHAHVVYTPEHANAAIAATADSGIRSIFAYSVALRMTEWSETGCVPSGELLPEWALSQLGRLVEQYNRNPQDHDATVEIGLGFDLWFLPKDMILGLLKELGSKGLRVVTTHVSRNALQGFHSVIQLLSSYDLLQPPYPPPGTYTGGGARLPFLLLSHCNGVEEEDLSVVASKGAPISSTPDTEAQMGMGWPVGQHRIFRKGEAKSTNVSLGADCHSNNPSSIVLQARALLQLARLEKNNRIIADGRFPREKVLGSSEAAYNLMTIRGARCLGLENEVGSIALGKKADIVVFDAEHSVGMLAAADHDPVTAIVRFSEAADIDTVIVNGTVRKRDGKIVDVGVSMPLDAERKTIMAWSDIAGEVRKSRKEIQARIDGLNLARGKDVMLSMFHVDESKLVDAS